MEIAYHAVLLRRLKIDHQVAATQQVEAGEWRILDDVLHGKHDHLADFLLHLVARVVLGEEASQPLRRDILRDVGRVAAGAGAGDGLVVEVRGVDLYIEVVVGIVHVLAQQHGDRVGFLAGGAARHPGAEDVRRRAEIT